MSRPRELTLIMMRVSSLGVDYGKIEKKQIEKKIFV